MCLTTVKYIVLSVSYKSGEYVPHEHWDKGCSPLLSVGREMSMSQADKQPLLVILSLLVL